MPKKPAPASRGKAQADRFTDYNSYFSQLFNRQNEHKKGLTTMTQYNANRWQKQRPATNTTDAGQGGDSVKTCRNCGKKFIAKLPYHICCSWDCTQQHKAQIAQQVEAEREPSEYPF